jgi:UDP-glucose 4-epimerase
MTNATQARLLVTGGAGFIGSHLVPALLRRWARVVVVDDLSTGRREHVPEAAPLVVADLATAELSPILAEHRPDLVVHLAAQANVRRSVTNPVGDAQSNVIATLRLLEACRATSVGRLVFASSGGAIYGEQECIPTPEDARPRPASPYGAAKLSIEHYLGVYQTTSGLASQVLRFGNVYGPRQLPEGEAGVVAIFLERMLRGQSVSIFGDGSQTRDYVFVEDVVDAVCRAVDRTLSARPVGPINVGTGIESSVSQIVRALEKALGQRADVRHEPAIAGELQRNALDVRRARAELGWQPRVSLPQGIATTASWFRDRVASQERT